ncbi:putative membrane-associated protein [Thioflavicoccus mobilis 8321]|uniref:Putative membrane-associated protein n=1 Tax=Thioflavicoccus mobilis 8321 TaxID=765912 RepID=L0GUF6_9GAMM|nr:bifunctional DedA family/phosphatase PAP2 family protein [Thioflavicoccus mobilis]AGA88944.1 putative membrane-associated protein [Thioflavicoccus mobilis 8321]
MEALFQQVLAWVAAHPTWANLILFLAALAESLAIVGIIVPGVLIMLAAGALIAAGALDLRHAWIAATLGAIIGDGLSYGLGRLLKDRVRDLWPFARHPESLARGERFFARYGTKSVVFGRFVGPIRAVVPLIAGMMGMGARPFLVANVLSAIAWAPAYLLPGIVFGASLTLAAEAATRLVILALILIALLWLAGWATRRLFALLSPHASSWVSHLLRWADLHPSMGKVARALADPAHPDAATLAGLAGLLILAAFLFGLTISITLIGPATLIVNQAVLNLGLSLHSPPADTLMVGLNRLGDPLVLLVLVAVVFLYLRWRRHRRHANYWLAAAGFALVAAPALGWLLQIPRPVAGLIELTRWSFPGSQVLGATLVYGFLAIAVARGLTPAWRWTPYVLAALIVTAVALARLYFGAEWLSDVVGSIALGLAWVAVLGLAFRRHSRFDQRWPGLVGVATLALTVGFTARTLTNHGDDLARYSPAPEPVAIAASAWRDGGWRELPHQRVDLWQHNRHPLDIQYAGPPDELAERLAPLGWHSAEPLTWRNAVRLLSPTLPLTELPVIPHIHDGHHEVLVLAKDEPGNGRRLVLRLWPTRYRLDGQAPIRVGNVTTQHKEVLVGFVALPITDDDSLPAEHRLSAELQELAETGAPLPILILPPPSGDGTPQPR